MARTVLKDKHGNDITWLQATIKAMELIGYPTTVDEIFRVIVSEIVEEIPESAKTPTQTVYGQIYTHSHDSVAGKDGENIFYSTGEKGVWGLIDNSELNLDVGMSDDDFAFPEGRAVLQKHLYRERNRILVNKAKKMFAQKNGGRLYCEICRFDFSEVYGKAGKDFIEAHHIKPVAKMRDSEKTKIDDLVMLCSNCHRMVHRIRPWIDNKNDLKKILTYKD